MTTSTNKHMRLFVDNSASAIAHKQKGECAKTASQPSSSDFTVPRTFHVMKVLHT